MRVVAAACMREMARKGAIQVQAERGSSALAVDEADTLRVVTSIEAIG